MFVCVRCGAVKVAVVVCARSVESAGACMCVHFCVCLCTYVCVDGESYIPLLSGVNGNIIVWF